MKKRSVAYVFLQRLHFNIILLLFAVSFCLCLYPINSFAAQSESDAKVLFDQKVYEQVVGLYEKNSSLTDLSLGEQIPTYLLNMNQELEGTSFELYPLFYSGDLLCLVIYDEYGDVNLSDGFCEEIKPFAGESIAIIYDDYGSVILSNDGQHNELQRVHSTGYPMNERGVVDENNDSIEIQTTILAPSYPLTGVQMEMMQNNRSGLVATISVPLVSQGSGTKLCWMASITCIGNKLTDSSYTTLQNAQWWANSTDPNVYDHGANISEANLALVYRYSLDMPYRSENTCPTYQKIYNNISADYPMYGKFWKYGTFGDSVKNHAVVVRGINTGISRMYIMNPTHNVGYMTATLTNGGCNYIQPQTGDLWCMVGYGSFIE